MVSVAKLITTNSEEIKLQMRPYVIRSKYSSPASLPLFFFVGFQLRDRNNTEHEQVRSFTLYMYMTTVATLNVNTTLNVKIIYTKGKFLH